jgi:hypothetical protein
MRPICRALMPSLASRNVRRICRIVSSLFAGIQSSSLLITRGKMPELLTQPKTQDHPTRWPELNRNGGRLQIGTVADIKSVSLAGFRRNPQSASAETI